MRVITGHVHMTTAMFDDLKRTESAWRELEWIATHWDEATEEQRARYERFSEAVRRMEDDERECPQ